MARAIQFVSFLYTTYFSSWCVVWVCLCGWLLFYFLLLLFMLYWMHTIFHMSRWNVLYCIWTVGLVEHGRNGYEYAMHACMYGPHDVSIHSLSVCCIICCVYFFVRCIHLICGVRVAVVGACCCCSSAPSFNAIIMHISTRLVFLCAECMVFHLIKLDIVVCQ